MPQKGKGACLLQIVHADRFPARLRALPAPRPLPFRRPRPAACTGDRPLPRRAESAAAWVSWRPVEYVLHESRETNVERCIIFTGSRAGNTKGQ